MGDAVLHVEDEQFVVFRLAGEQYGITIGAVQEIILPQSVTRLPNMPEFAEGIINLRGRIIPIIGLSKQFGLQHRGDASAARIVVAGIGGMAIGLVVDDVVGVERVATSSIQPAPSILSVGTAVVRGVTRVDDRVVILLDQDRILLHEEQRLLERASR